MRTASVWLALAALWAAPQETVRPWRTVEPGHELEFPRDHGAHPEFRTEWWYVTGNLEDERGRRFGAQLTFFRAGLGEGIPPADANPLRAHQVWAGHLVLVDVARGETRLAERLRRGGSSLVRASLTGLDFALEDWELTQGEDGRIALRAADPAAGIALDLTLSPAKPLVLHGEGGVSAKGHEPGNAAAYAAWTRLATVGSIAIDGRVHAVRGESWLDHEFGSGQLGAGVIGWDWFGLQLQDGRELMVYSLRRDDGTPHPLSGGTLVALDGTPRALALSDFAIEVQSTWKSPRTGATYPARWTISVPSAGLRLEARPLVPDCELDTRSTDVLYWEGPVELTDSSGAAAGRGYAELVGYAHGMSGRF